MLNNNARMRAVEAERVGCNISVAAAVPAATHRFAGARLRQASAWQARPPFGRTRPVASLPLQSLAGDTPAATVTLDRLRRFRLGMATRPRLRQVEPELDCREHSSISARNFRRCAECDQRIQVAKGGVILPRQISHVLNRQLTLTA